MPAEDEAMSMVLRVGDTVVQSAEQILMILLRAVADAQKQSAQRRALTGREGFFRRVSGKAVDAVTSRIDGLGDRGIVSQKVANPDGTSMSYTIDAGVLTQDDLKKLSREFATRQIQVGVRSDKPPSTEERADDRWLGRVEFTVKRDQVEQFEAALARIAPAAIASEEEDVARKKGDRAKDETIDSRAAAWPPPPPWMKGDRVKGETIDGAKVLDGRSDLKLMCSALNDNGINVAFTRDASGCVEIHVKGSADVNVFQESLKVAARAYGLSDEQIEMSPIRRGERGEYPDSFVCQGMAFERKRPGLDTWVAHDPQDGRTEVSVSIEHGRPAYEITRNGSVVASSSADRVFYFAHEQPVESGCLAAASALDRSRRTAEREAAAKVVETRGKASRGSDRTHAKSASSETAKRNREAARVARKANEAAARKGETRHQGAARL